MKRLTGNPVLGKDRHNWISHNGKLKVVCAKCVTCGVTREKLGISKGGYTYFRENIELTERPDCK